MTTNAKNLVSELLPCPFCGWGEVEIVEDETGRYCAMCDNCMAMASPNENREGAMGSWQARAQAGDAVSERECLLCEECTEYLKDGETPRQRIDRERRDSQSLIKLLAEARKGIIPDELKKAIRAIIEAVWNTDIRVSHSTHIDTLRRWQKDYTTPPHDGGKVARDALPTMSDSVIDRHLDNVLKASGSALRNYSMAKTIAMRVAMRRAIGVSDPSDKAIKEQRG